jgi:hypothetical protein
MVSASKKLLGISFLHFLPKQHLFQYIETLVFFRICLHQCHVILQHPSVISLTIFFFSSFYRMESKMRYLTTLTGGLETLLSTGQHSDIDIVIGERTSWYLHQRSCSEYLFCIFFRNNIFSSI